MTKPEVDSILIANSYLVRCKFEDSDRNRTELARKFLTQKIKKTLNKRIIFNEDKNSLYKVFSFFLLDFMIK
jgi:hypothetical protein